MNQDMKNIPTIFVIFGATGDLISKKIVPALFHLFQKGELPKKLKIIGFSRRDLSQTDFQNQLEKTVEKYHHNNLKKEELKSFLDFFSYKKGDFENKDDYKKLSGSLSKIDDEWKVCSNKLFYLAVPPDYYKTIFNNLSVSGLTISCSHTEGWTRVIIEKPFGQNLETAKELDDLLGKLFKEEQIYRIDHYLAKEMLQNILAFRFSNNLFEDNWGNQLVEKIEIKLLEKIGVEDRGSFYDSVGALRDIGQNHLLQIMALMMMDHPLSLDSNSIRSNRAQILNTVAIPNQKEIINNSIRAQYQDYQNIKGIQKNSNKETYFKIRIFLGSNRWLNVPIILEGGKRLGTINKEIVVTFKHPTPCLCPPNKHYKNKVIFSLEPEEGIKIYFWSKKPGLKIELEERIFNFLLRADQKKHQYIEEYEKLLLDCITGDQTLFVSTEEIRSMWQIIDPIISTWEKNLVPLKTYQPDSDQILKEADFTDDFSGKNKEMGLIGLGKMGSNMAKRLLEKKWKVVGYNRSPEVTEELAKVGLNDVFSLESLVSKLERPRKIWLMLPSGKAIDEIIFDKNGLASLLDKRDVIIDGGNSFYKDSMKRHEKLQKRGIHFLDVGVSGGPGGARYGACLMIGGDRKIFSKLEYLFADFALPNGYQFFDGAGAGHFIKMIHNGIEYGMMQAIAEGFNILKYSDYSLDLKKVAKIYNNGSVIESRLTNWLEKSFDLHGVNLKEVSGSVKHTGEGEWTIKTAKEMKLKAKIIERSFNFRVLSEKNPSYTGKILSALRQQFGGHKVK